MCVAGIDAHATYPVIAIVSNTAQLVHGPVRINNKEAGQLQGGPLERRVHDPVGVTVEVSGDLAAASGSGSMLLEVEGQEVTETFDFTDVFRKDEQGTWLYSSVNFNSKDAPA